MDTFLVEHGGLVFLVIIIGSYIWGLLWQALMHKVWGGKIIKELASGRSLYFKTKKGEYRLESTHKKLSFKLAGQKAWESVDFTDIKDIHIFRSTDTASLIEFFMGDWGLWDIAGKYRDLLHTYSIQILLRDQRDIPIVVLKQYEQREWLLGRIFLRITLAVLKVCNLYRDGEEVAQETLEMFAEKFRLAGCDIKVRY